MVASTAERFDIEGAAPIELELPVAAGVKCYKGTLLIYNDAGYAQPGGDTVLGRLAGECARTVDNSSGVDGAVKVPVIPPARLRLIELDAVSPTDAWNGDNAYLTDDHTVALGSSVANNVHAGQIVAVITKAVAGRVVIDTNRRAD